MFESIGTAGTGLQTYHTWLDVIAENIANVNDTAPTNGTVFHTHYLQAQAIGSGPGGAPAEGSGVEVASLSQSAGNGVMVQDPSNPIADANGYVRHTDVDLGTQMTDMIMAQRAFQANASVVDRAKDTYEAAINIGKGV
jgi:flagellar basal-body rod protein FlgC